MKKKKNKDLTKSTVLEFRDVSEALEADLTRDDWKHLDEGLLKLAERRLGGVQDLIDNGLAYNIGNYLPLPIPPPDYEINPNVLQASRTLGRPLDTTLAGRAGRKILEKLERDKKKK